MPLAPLRRLFRKSLAGILSLALIATAPGDGAFAYGGDGGGGAAPRRGAGAKALSDAATNAVARTLTGGAKACTRLPKVYRYDCYRQTYARAVRQLDGSKAYAPARKVLADVEKSLARTISRNADRSVKPLRRLSGTFQPIKPAALPRAKQEFTRALDQAETRLLRSAGRSNTHFIRIAEALNTNKVLLRSAQALFQRFARLVTQNITRAA